MQLDDGCFCHEVVRGDPTPRGRSLRYTLIVLLGLLRAESAGRGHAALDSGALHGLALDELGSLGAAEHGLLLWADCRRGAAHADLVLDGLERAISHEGGPPALEGLALAWAAIGLSEVREVTGGERLDTLRNAVLGPVVEKQADRGVVLHRGARGGGRVPHIATQIYGVLALARAGGRGDDRALVAARRLGDRLCEMQRPNGGWPWLFDTRRGRVIEPFEVYATHQDGMAPMALLELSEASGEPRYRDAALSGLNWVWGENELREPMLDLGEEMLYRSIVRRPPLDRLAIYANTLGSYAGWAPLARVDRGLRLNATDRPYHLGWILEAWCGREPGASDGAARHRH